jgi:hypothetical protein
MIAPKRRKRLRLRERLMDETGLDAEAVTVLYDEYGWRFAGYSEGDVREALGREP